MTDTDRTRRVSSGGDDDEPVRADVEQIVGLDLGQSRDWSAWVVAERTKLADETPASYAVRHIDRIRGVSYPQVVAHTAALVRGLLARPARVYSDRPSKRPKPRVSLVVDYTGAGRPVCDLIAEANLGVPTAFVTITGADATTRGENGDWRVPKRLLASTVQVGLQTGRLTIEKRLALAETLRAELQGFRVKISLTGHDSYGAGEDWRSAPHDDLVLSLALGIWWGEHRPPSWADADAESWGEALRSLGYV